MEADKKNASDEARKSLEAAEAEARLSIGRAEQKFEAEKVTNRSRTRACTRI